MEARTKADTNAEIAALAQKLKGADAMPSDTTEEQLKREEARGKVLAAITETQIRGTSALNAAQQQRAMAIHTLSAEELMDVKKLQEASGDRAGAAVTNLAIEAKAYDDLLKKVGTLTDAERAAKIAAFTDKGTALIAANRDQKKADEGMESLGEGVSAIQEKAANGSINNVSAAAQILALQQSSLATLRQIGEQWELDARLSENPEAIAAADKYNAKLDQMQAKLTNVTTAQTQLYNELATQGTADFEGFFSSTASGTASASDAFKTLAQDFEKMVGDMVAKLLIFYALEAIIGWVAPLQGSDFAKALSSAGPFGSLTGHAGGGWTGDGPTDKIAGFVHGQEVVVRAGPAARNRALLEAINAGMDLQLQPASSQAAQVSSAVAATVEAQGSGSGFGPTAAPAPQIQIVTPPNTQAQMKQSTGANGASFTQIIISTIGQDIAQGGQIAKQMESTYGVARSGVKRG